MSGDQIYRSFKYEFSSFELNNEKSSENRSFVFNNLKVTNSTELETNIITIIKEMENKNSYSCSSSASNFLLENSNYQGLKEKGKYKKNAFIYVMIMIFLSLFHFFNATNLFILLYIKDNNFYDEILLFAAVGLVINGVWFMANLIVVLALFKKNTKFMLCGIGLLFFDLIIFITDLILYIYMKERTDLEKFGIREMTFLILEGIFIIFAIFGSNYFRVRIERIKLLKSLEISD